MNGFYIRQKSPEKLTELCLLYLIEEGLITPLFKEKQYPPAYGAKEIVPQYEVSSTREKIDVVILQKIVSIYQERLKKLSEISKLTDFFFKDKLEYDKDMLKWKEMTDKEIKRALDILIKILSKLKEGDFNKRILESLLLSEAEKFSQKMEKVGDRGYLLWPLRVALTGKKASATPFEIAEILGKEKTLKRLKKAKELL